MDPLFESYWYGKKKPLKSVSIDSVQIDDEEGKAWTTFKQAVQEAIKSDLKSE